MSKSCFVCRNTKPLSEFYRHSRMADGHLGKCKDCTKRYVREHRRRNDSVREYDRERAKTPARKVHIRAVSKKWREDYPEKYRAQTALGNALRDGKVAKEPCYFCGAKEVHGHHKDYSKPLEVTWLCPKCHHRLHRIAA